MFHSSDPIGTAMLDSMHCIQLSLKFSFGGWPGNGDVRGFFSENQDGKELAKMLFTHFLIQKYWCACASGILILRGEPCHQTIFKLSKTEQESIWILF
jgi:hypothetical protein